MLSEHTRKARQAAQDLLSALSLLHHELEAVALPTSVERLADYAWSGYAFANENNLREALHDISSAVELCEANLMLPNGEQLFDEENKILIRQVSNAAHARMSLDAGDSVRVEELAALARVAEKTIRMATNKARPGSMRVRKNGHWALIDAPEALAWLARRDDFQPTHKRGYTLEQPLITTAGDLAATCRHWREIKITDVTALAKTLGWNAPQRKAYEQLERGELSDELARFSPQALLALGEYFGLPQPKDFARQAYRVLALKHAEDLSDRQLADAVA